MNWNRRINIVLNAARQQANAPWCNQADGLRRLEAALFMVGYDLPQRYYI